MTAIEILDEIVESFQHLGWKVEGRLCFCKEDLKGQSEWLRKFRQKFHRSLATIGIEGSMDRFRVMWIAEFLIDDGQRRIRCVGTTPDEAVARLADVLKNQVDQV